MGNDGYYGVVIYRMAASLLYHGPGASVNAFFGIATMIISIQLGLRSSTGYLPYKGRVEFSASMWWTIAF